MSVLDRVREKFQTPMSGASKSSGSPSAGFAGSPDRHSESCDAPSAGFAGSSPEESESFDLRPEFAAALQCGRLVACIACHHFESRPADRPDGWCKQFTTETWGKVPFRCAGYVERRQ
jgi:hypothetical protein